MSGRENSLNASNTSDDPEIKPLGGFKKIDRSPARLKKISLRRSLKEVSFEYFENASLNGVQYFGQQRPWYEITLWLCLLVVSIYCCSVTVKEVYNKWMDAPVIVTFSEKSTDIWTIPFPAVTICPESKRKWNGKGPSYQNLLNDLVEQADLFQPNISSKELEEFLTLLHVCDTTPDYQLAKVTVPPIDYFRVLNNMSIDFVTYFPRCALTSRRFFSCDLYFTKTYTDDGLCYTFNGLNGTDLYRENTVQHKEMGMENSVRISNPELLNRTLSWSLERGYAPNSALNTYPARVLTSGSKAGFNLYLRSMDNEKDFGCRGHRQGFKLLLHSPADVPLTAKQYVRIAMGNEILISVKPNMMITSEGIAKYGADKRLCLLANERYLKFFKIYSEINCELECLTNFTLNECGCVKFSMPRTPDMKVCTEDKIDCYEGAEEKLMKKDYSGDVKDSNNKCDCMPACTSLEFDMEISQGDLEADNANNAIVGEKDSFVSIFYKDNEFTTSKRSEFSGLYDFLSNCGGVLGLFTGFSILSGIEIVYHFTLRLWTNMRRGKKEEAIN